MVVFQVFFVVVVLLDRVCILVIVCFDPSVHERFYFEVFSLTVHFQYMFHSMDLPAPHLASDICFALSISVIEVEYEFHSCVHYYVALAN